MAQFDLSTGLGKGRGYVVDVQADLPERLATRIVVPLVPQPQAEVLRDLMPVIEIAEAMFYSRKN